MENIEESKALDHCVSDDKESINRSISTDAEEKPVNIPKKKDCTLLPFFTNKRASEFFLQNQ